MDNIAPLILGSYGGGRRGDTEGSPQRPPRGGGIYYIVAGSPSLEYHHKLYYKDTHYI